MTRERIRLTESKPASRPDNEEHATQRTAPKADPNRAPAASRDRIVPVDLSNPLEVERILELGWRRC